MHRMPVAQGSDYQTPKTVDAFKRLVLMLRPWWWVIGVALVLLLASMPCDLFPAFVWQYVTDDLVLTGVSHPTGFHAIVERFLQWMMSLDGALGSKLHLLISATLWLTVVYVLGELLGTVSTVLMQRVAQRFIYVLRNRMYHKIQSQSIGYLQRQRTGDLMSRAMSDVDELQNFTVNAIDTIVGEGVLWLVTVVVVFLESWRVAAVSLAPLVLVYFMLRVFNRKVRPIY
jgi:ABC-type multidrug transport system fused ATPase/permease subunit